MARDIIRSNLKSCREYLSSAGQSSGATDQNIWRKRPENCIVRHFNFEL